MYRYESRADVRADADKLAQMTIDFAYGEPNETRADWGQAGVMLACPDFSTGGNGLATDVTDALANIAHFCDRAGLNFEALAAGAVESRNGDYDDGEPAARDDHSIPESDH
jgi:hypothetical protein